MTYGGFVGAIGNAFQFLEAMWEMTSFSRTLSEDVILEAIELMTSSSRPWGNDVILEAMG